MSQYALHGLCHGSVYFLGAGSYDLVDIFSDRGKGYERVDFINLYNVDLYAGLSEQVKQIGKGKPAHIDEPLHVRQRMLYMDEECLPFYQAGGMKFDSIREFDRWLTRRAAAS